MLTITNITVYVSCCRKQRETVVFITTLQISFTMVTVVKPWLIRFFNDKKRRSSSFKAH